MLVAEQLTKAYGRKTALHEASFTLSNGITGLLGPNGAGKTTLLRILSTYHQPTTGKLTLDGVQWSRKNMEHIRSLIGYLPQHVGLFPALTVREYLSYIGSMRGMDSRLVKERTEEVLHEVNLADKAREQVRSLSGGMKQRLGIAQAILHEPSLLLVDEPTAGLDPEERIRFRNLVKRLAFNRAVLLSTHITGDITMTCDRVFLMKQGRLEAHEHVHSVTGYASGRVWGLYAGREEYERLLGNPALFITDAAQQIGGGYNLRIIAQDEPCAGAELVQPTLEEGYMVWLNGN
ncbi:ABC transporter ATP-binding protein [Paenibacillus sambharensis]|uniref:ABC transporter ATP-binding protein n=1 Tax=Paenibacillus sambharensis TaxID=1803190 RepID=A0A2W1LDR6_9BACL|nr:ATP-binding cassette domain-containing protein [Paenibacillus sambharensis]PZD93212.1 ABC transporter ATP-binding protein [Paenibacillus sambharensis]